MSRLGKRPIPLPQGVSCSLSSDEVLLKGPKGEHALSLPAGVSCALEGDMVTLRGGQSGRGKVLWGMAWSLVKNAIHGVSQGFSIDMKMEGVGYRAALAGRSLKMQLGFSHDVVLPLPEHVNVVVKSPTEFSVEGHCKQKVGQVVSDIQAFRPPEPYKGKGIHRVGQYVLRKKGKKK